ncbi:MAG: hypothetical protein D6706_17395, partial [Chloroflexi bacterium]
MMTKGLKFLMKQKLTVFLVGIGLLIFITACNNSQPESVLFSENPNSSNTSTGTGSGYPVSAYPSAQEQPTEATPVPLNVPKFSGQIAFQTEQFDGNLQIAVLDGATGQTRRVSQNFFQAAEPTWSPDCRELIFTVGLGSDVDFELYRQTVGEDNARPFLNHSDSYDWAAAWSPNGNVIAYQNNMGQRLNVCFVDSQGNELGCMPETGFDNAMPAWSPDGSRLVFASTRDGNWELYVTNYPAMDVVTRLTNHDGSDFDPAW